MHTLHSYVKCPGGVQLLGSYRNFCKYVWTACLVARCRSCAHMLVSQAAFLRPRAVAVCLLVPAASKQTHTWAVLCVTHCRWA